MNHHERRDASGRAAVDGMNALADLVFDLLRMIFGSREDEHDRGVEEWLDANDRRRTP
ncbi:MAG TPA: hypothetical protein VMV18_10355 [bacterium]|nr:hypothetical protein [bacterium]